MNKRKNGKKQSEIISIAEVPLAIIQAMTLIQQSAEDHVVVSVSREDAARLRNMLREAFALLDSVMLFIAGGNCNLGELALADGQQAYLRYVFEQFAKGEEIEMGHTVPTIVSTV